MKTKTEIANEIVDSIIVDISDRRGIGSEWHEIDLDIQNEIRETWVELIYEKLGECE